MRKLLLIPMLLSMIFAASAQAEVAPATSPATNIMVVMLENHSFAEVDGQMPYLNGLASQYVLLTHHTALMHPSLPNYLALTGGSNFGVKDDNNPSSHPLNFANVFSQVGSANWKAYNQSIPSPCFKTNKLPYVAHHNPAAYYTTISAADCTANDVTDATLASDVSSGSLRPFTMLIPDKCHDGHEDLKCGDNIEDGTARADAYLSNVIPMIQAGPQFQNGSLLIELVWDEGDKKAQTVYTVLVGQGHTGQVADALTHYSILKYNESVLGVPCLLNACTAPGLVLP